MKSSPTTLAVLALVSTLCVVVRADPVLSVNVTSQTDRTIFRKELTGIKCAGSTDNAASTEVACHAAAVAASNAFYSFSPSTSTCKLSDDCSAREADSNFAVYKQWHGAFNSTHANEDPENTGSISADSNCKTQIAVGSMRNHLTCTSCEAGRGFAIMFHAARAGSCREYLSTPQVFCIKLNSNDLIDPTTDQDRICSKLTESHTDLPLTSMTGAAKTYFAGVESSSSSINSALARCRVRKETVCQSGKCDTIKRVACIDACEVTAFGPPRAYANCDSSLCNGAYAHTICENAAMME